MLRLGGTASRKSRSVGNGDAYELTADLTEGDSREPGCSPVGTMFGTLGGRPGESSLTQNWSFRFDLDLRDSLDRRLRPDALVVQEDRNLVMGGQAILDLDTEDDLDSAYLAGRDHRPIPLGQFLLLRARANTQYCTYQAVVHDFELEPTCRPGDVRRSLTGIVGDAAGRGLQTLASEPLGEWRGRGLHVEEVVDAFDSAILESSQVLDVPFRLILLLDGMDQLEEVSHHLRSRVLARASRSFRTVSDNAAVVEVRNEEHRFHFRFVPGTLSGYLVTRLDVLV